MRNITLSFIVALLIHGVVVGQAVPDTAGTGVGQDNDLITLLAELGLDPDRGLVDSPVVANPARLNASASDRQAGISWQYRQVADMAAPYSVAQRTQLEGLLRSINVLLSQTADSTAGAGSTLTSVSPGDDSSMVGRAVADTDPANGLTGADPDLPPPDWGRPAIEVDSPAALTGEYGPGDAATSRSALAVDSMSLSEWIVRLKSLIEELESTQKNSVMN